MPSANSLLELARSTAPLAVATDADLLARYTADRDEAAFAEIVRRNGPNVLRACRTIAGPDAADDAFQAVFLLLARKAGRITRPGSLAGWLHAVAVRTARTARRAAARRRKYEASAAPPAAPDDVTWREVREAIDTALAELPEKYRTPLVLCYLQNLGVGEAARRCGCSVGAFRGRLERGREKLRWRLERHGLTVAAPLLALGSPAPLSAAVVGATVSVVRVGLASGGFRSILVGAVAFAALTVGTLAVAFPRPTSVAPIAPTPTPAADPPAEWTYPVTDRGKPATGAKVGLVPHTYPTPGIPKAGTELFATVDAKGEVRFPKAADVTLARLVARGADGRGGYGLLYSGRRHPATIELLENTELTGRVTDGEGKAVAGLKLKPASLGADSVGQHNGRMVANAEPSDWFWESFPPQLAADGTFKLTGVPAGHSASVKFEAPGFGAGRFWVVSGKPTAVTLRKAGAVRVAFAVPDGAKPGDIRITATRVAGPEFLEATADMTAKAGAGATLADLPPGEYAIDFPFAGPAPLFPKDIGKVTVKPGETTTVTATLEPAARITAKLVDAKTGKGVPGAKLSASITRANGGYVPVTDAKADADGKLELLVPSGMLQVMPRGADGYAAVKVSSRVFDQLMTEPVQLAPGKAHDFGIFTLVKTVEIAGVVTDDADKPIAGASVAVGYSGGNHGTVSGLTDAEGRFVAKGLNPEGGVVGLTARKGNAITASPVAVDPGKPDGEVRVVVSEKYAAKIRVRAVDAAGKPLDQVGVELMHSVTFLTRGGGIAGSGTGGRVGSTGTDGRFESAILQAGDRYTASLSAPGYRTANAPEWEAKPGETRDFGDLVMTRSDVSASGVVTDASGKPIAGATVFSNADGPRPTSTTTDAAGRFTLGGLYEGAALVSVRADGFRLASAATGAGPVTVKLRKLTDPPDAPPVISDEHKAATAKLARHLLAGMWANRVAAADDGKTVVKAMAKLDPATARRWRDEEKTRTGGKSDLTAEIAAAERDVRLLQTAKEDIDEAIALLKSHGGIEGFRAACELAEKLLADSPAKALRVAEEAVVRARGMEEAERAWTLAQAGELVFRAGKPDAGRKVIEEAAKLVEPLAFAELDGYRRGMVAVRVALFDPVACRKMIDPMTGANDFNRWLAHSCSRVALHHLPTAKKWLTEFRPDNSFHKHFAPQGIAYRIAATSPDEAVALARGVTDRTIRASALVGVAGRIKAKDAARAAKLIDEAFDQIVADPTGYYNGGGGGTAAMLLFRAKEIGHPDLAALRDKVLAARNTPVDRQGDRGMPTFLLALAATDPAAAKLMLPRALPPAARANLGPHQNSEAVLALILADPAAATPVLDAMLARVVAAKKGYDYTGIDTLARVLTDPDPAAAGMRAAALLGDFSEE